jgi:hypothetical protein
MSNLRMVLDVVLQPSKHHVVKNSWQILSQKWKKTVREKQLKTREKEAFFAFDRGFGSIDW